MREQKGITLIALVITIIVLLILAGVSIAMLTGDNGLLTKANDSKVQTVRAEAVDRINMALQATFADLLSGSTTNVTKTKIEDDNDLTAEYAVTVKSSLTEEGETVKIVWTPTDSSMGAAITGKITCSSTGEYTLVAATK